MLQIRFSEVPVEEVIKDSGQKSPSTGLVMSGSKELPEARAMSLGSLAQSWTLVGIDADSLWCDPIL